jgi:hypothetical protein
MKPEEWRQSKADHRQRISELIDDYLKQRSEQEKDPVMDFLFEYYAFRPSYLKSWSPGFGTLLVSGASVEWRFDEMKYIDGNCHLDLNHFPE